MTPMEIKIELLRNGTNQATIARNLNPPCTPQSVHTVIEKRWVSARIMKAVATAIKKDVETVFPEYYQKSA